jgi:p-hydroxybenzoate 3-monooxygenase
MRTQVGIVGAGPAGLLLSQLLHLQGVESTVLECRDRRYVEHRVRAGVLEHGSAETLREASVGKRLDAEGMRHEGIELRFEHHGHRVDFADLVGRTITVYGQQEVVKDLIAARLDAGGDVRFEITDIALSGLDGVRPRIRFAGGALDCDFVVGADGSHGVSREYVPGLTTYERGYPYAWLGILAQAPPSAQELIYARHERGFALHSMRTPSITRLYLQVAQDERLDAWPDARIWSELATRFTDDAGFSLSQGPVLDKGITPMRSVVATPMQYGRLFLAGDAAHIVPPTGAKGLNLALSDVTALAKVLTSLLRDRQAQAADAYSDTCLSRVWRATHFSWWMTSMLHVDPHDDQFGARLQLSQLRYVISSRAAATTLAENYTGYFPPTWD